MEEGSPAVRGKIRHNSITMPYAPILAFGIVFSWIALCLTIAKAIENKTINHTIEPTKTIAVRTPHPVSVDLETKSPDTPDAQNPTDSDQNTEDRFYGIILEAASRHQVDPALVKAVIKAESGYNELAVSKKGAVGLMQLMPKTARALGVVDSLDPEHNINGGVKYLKQLMDRFDGDVRLALAAYNAGSKRVREYQGIPPFKATRYYIKKVLSYYRMYKEDQMDDSMGNA